MSGGADIIMKVACSQMTQATFVKLLIVVYLAIT